MQLINKRSGGRSSSSSTSLASRDHHRRGGGGGGGGTNSDRVIRNTNTNTNTNNYIHKKYALASCQLVAFVSLLGLTLFTNGHFNLHAAAKPLNTNQVKFRRLPPKEFSASLGSSITIECEAGASPPPTIHWLKDGRRISQNEFDENQLEDSQPMGAIQVDDVTRISLSATRSRLFIDCADNHDEATYTCVAENAYSRLSAHTKLNLIKPPRVTQLSGNDNDLMAGSLDEMAALELAAAIGGDKDKSVSGGGASPLSAIPQCLSQRQQLGARATDSTPARIHMWTHNIVEIMKNNVILYCRSNIKKQQQVAAAATTTTTTSQNSQQAAQSQQQDASSSSDLISSTNNNEQLLDQDSAPQSASSLLLTENDTSAAATTTTDRRLLVSWTLPNDKLVSAEQKGKYEILETGDLLIKDLRWGDMGSYVCTVSDEQSSDSISAFVYPTSTKTGGGGGSISGGGSGGSSNNKRFIASNTATKSTNQQANRLFSFDR